MSGKAAARLGSGSSSARVRQQLGSVQTQLKISLAHIDSSTDDSARLRLDSEGERLGSTHLRWTDLVFFFSLHAKPKKLFFSINRYHPICSFREIARTDLFVQGLPCKWPLQVVLLLQTNMLPLALVTHRSAIFHGHCTVVRSVCFLYGVTDLVAGLQIASRRPLLPTITHRCDLS